MRTASWLFVGLFVALVTSVAAQPFDTTIEGPSAVTSGGLCLADISLEDYRLYMDLTNDVDTYIEQNTTSDTMRLAIGGAYIDVVEDTADAIDFNSFAFTETSYTIPATVTVTANAATIDWANGVAQVIDLNGSTLDVTLTLSNPRTGGSYFIKIIQGSNLDDITWPAAVKWSGGTAPTITDTDDAVDSVACLYDGTIYMCSWIGDYK